MNIYMYWHACLLERRACGFAGLVADVVGGSQAHGFQVGAVRVGSEDSLSHFCEVRCPHADTTRWAVEGFRTALFLGRLSPTQWGFRTHPIPFAQ